MPKRTSIVFKSVCLSLILNLCLYYSGFAQEEQKPQERQGVSSISTFIKGRYEPKESPFARLKQKVYMDFQDVGLNEVLKLFSQQSGLNFIAAEEVKQRNLTLYLSGVTVEEALNAIMKANNLTYEAIGDKVFIVKESKRPKIDTVTRVFNIDYAQLVSYKEGEEQEQTSGIKAVIEKLLTEYGKVMIDSRTNSLIVTEIPDQMPLIEEMILALDTKTQQVLIDAQIIETNPSTAKRLGYVWGEQMFSYVGPSTSTKVPFFRNRYLRDSGSKTASFGTLTMSQFSIVQHMIEDLQDIKYLARPKVLTVNNKQAEITISADQAVGISSTSVSSTGQTTQEAERLEVGVSLKVTPQINKDNYITMIIEPTVSRAVQSPFFSQFVDRHSRSTKTNVMIRNGETIVISGLIQEDDRKTTTRIPFLGAIPVLGHLFRYDNKSKSRTELIVFLTPHILKTDVLTAEKTREQEELIEVPPKETEAKKKERLLPTEADLRKGIIYPMFREQEGFIFTGAK